MERWLKILLLVATVACAYTLLVPNGAYTFRPPTQFLSLGLLYTVLYLLIRLIPAGTTAPDVADGALFVELIFAPHLVIAPIVLGACWAQSRWQILPNERGLLGLATACGGAFIVPAYAKATATHLAEHINIELGKLLVIALVFAAYPIIQGRKPAIGVGILAGLGAGAFYTVERTYFALLMIPPGETWAAASGLWLESLGLLLIHSMLGGGEALITAWAMKALRPAGK